MARIALIEPEHANPEVKQIYDGTLRGKPGNAQKALAHRPEMLKNFLSFYASVGRRWTGSSMNSSTFAYRSLMAAGIAPSIM